MNRANRRQRRRGASVGAPATPFEMPVTRRGVLLGGAGALAATAAACGGSSASAGESADVIVVGTGFAGLAAAYDLRNAGASVVVLEARDRVGGRTLNAPIGGGKVVEIGGQWVGPGQSRILALAESMGVETFTTYNDGNNLLYYQGSLVPYSSTGLPPVPDGDLAELVTAIVSEIDPLASQISLDTPWDSAGVDSVALDGQTAETWKLANLGTPGARFLFDLSVEAVFACEPRDISYLHFLFYVHSGGGVIPLVSTAGGAQDSRFVGGSQLVAQRLADAVGAARIRFNTAARRIRQDDGGVTVETDAGTFHGNHVIVALAPTLCGRIDFDPPLPALRDQLTQRFPQGSVIKCQAVYPGPFWRDAGLSGQITSDTGPVKVTFDNSPPDGTPGVLLGFIEADEARFWSQRTQDERRQAVIESFTRYFGPQAASPTMYLEHDWSADRWTRGCYAGFLAPGVLTQYGPALRAPLDRIHWAGSETADVWNGYMDGAVRSGERAAEEVMAE